MSKAENQSEEETIQNAQSKKSIRTLEDCAVM